MRHCLTAVSVMPHQVTVSSHWCRRCMVKAAIVVELLISHCNIFCSDREIFVSINLLTKLCRWKLGGLLIRNHRVDVKYVFVFVCSITDVGDCCTAEVDKLSKAMKQAKAADIHVVDEEFLDDVGKSPKSVPQLIVQHSIATWGSDVSRPLCS